MRYIERQFIKILKTSTNPYGDGRASQKIVNKIKKAALKTILKKSFYDLKLT